MFKLLCGVTYPCQYTESEAIHGAFVPQETASS